VSDGIRTRDRRDHNPVSVGYGQGADRSLVTDWRAASRALSLVGLTRVYDYVLPTDSLAA